MSRNNSSHHVNRLSQLLDERRGRPTRSAMPAEACVALVAATNGLRGRHQSRPWAWQVRRKPRSNHPPSVPSLTAPIPPATLSCDRVEWDIPASEPGQSASAAADKNFAAEERLGSFVDKNGFAP